MAHETRSNISCPVPECPGSRCDIDHYDDNGNWTHRTSEPCNVCGG